MLGRGGRGWGGAEAEAAVDLRCFAAWTLRGEGRWDFLEMRFVRIWYGRPPEVGFCVLLGATLGWGFGWGKGGWKGEGVESLGVWGRWWGRRAWVKVLRFWFWGCLLEVRECRIAAKHFDFVGLNNELERQKESGQNPRQVGAGTDQAGKRGHLNRR